MSEALKMAVTRQRIILRERLSRPLGDLATACSEVWGEREKLERLLLEAVNELASCKYLYVLDAGGRQVTANISREGLHPDQCGRDRSARPYMQEAFTGPELSLSTAYLSRNNQRPTLTAVQRVHNTDQGLRGFIGADFDLRELPLTRELYQQPNDWLQLKGDPAIRSGLFYQQRVESLMDGQIDTALALLGELMTCNGVFHGKLHFSSSRATLWLIEDPYRFRILDYEDLTDPGICLAYPRHPYPEDAAIPPERIEDVLQSFHQLRFMDENIYLRSGSLNIFNGIVGLNFSCDGSHYMGWQDFLAKSLDFWLGAGVSAVARSLDGAVSDPSAL